METVVENHVQISPDVRAGKPRIAGTRITVADIVVMHQRIGQSLEEIAGRYDLSLASLHAAMVYYYDHKSEIDQSIEDEAALAEAFRRNNPSPLREKLKTLRDG